MAVSQLGYKIYICENHPYPLRAVNVIVMGVHHFSTDYKEFLCVRFCGDSALGSVLFMDMTVFENFISMKPWPGKRYLC